MDTALVAARFWPRVNIASGDACWEWNGPRHRAGYGAFSYRARSYYAHRMSMTLAGEDVSGKVVMHLCDNPPCVRPDHLKVGTQAENRADCAAKGRNPTNGNQYKTHCKRGHAFVEHGRLTGRGPQRVCRKCEALRHARRRADDRAIHADDATWLPR